MSFSDSTNSTSSNSNGGHTQRRARRSTKKKPRVVNYKSRSTMGTLTKQAQIMRWIRVADEGFTVSEIAALLGISRQLALYHVKKMAATAQLIMVLEPCDGNGGLQYKIWDHTQLVVNFIPKQAVAA
jgi:hypothetical protein